MSVENKKDELLDKLIFLAIAAFIIAAYSAWSDESVYKLLNYNPHAADEVGIFTRIIAMIAGTVSGTVIGLLAYLCKSLLVSATQYSDKSFQYVIMGWMILIVGVVGGSIFGVKYILLWMA